MLSKIQPPFALSAGAASVSGSGTVVFSNSNGVSFGANGSTITASVAPGGGAFSAQGGSSTFQTLTFSNANGFTFSNSAGAVVGSYTVPSQSVQTQASGAIAGTGFTSTTTAGTAVVGTQNTAGLSVGVPLFLTTAMQSNAATISNVNVSAGTTSQNLSNIVFSNSNGLAFGLSGSTITGSYTTPAQTNQTLSFAATSNTAGNTSGLTVDARSLTIAGYGNALVGFSTSVGGSTVVVSVTTAAQTNQTEGAYASSQTVGQSSSSTYDARSLSIVGSGEVSVGWSNSSLLIQAPPSSIGVSTGGGTSGNTGTYSGQVVFAGGNNITLSVGTAAGGAQTITISGPNAGGAQTGISGVVVSNTTYTSGTVSFSNANGISFGSSAGQAITASYTVPTITSWTVSDTVTSQTVGRLAFTAANGLTMTLSTSNNGNATVFGSYTVPTTAGLISGLNVSGGAGNSQSNVSGITFSNSNGITFGVSTGANVVTVTASYTVPTQSAQTLSAIVSSNTVGNTSGMTFDARSVSFQGFGAASVGLSTTNTGSSILFSVPVQTNQTLGLFAVGNTTSSSSSTSLDARSLSFSGSGAISVGMMPGAVIISAPATSSLSATGAFSISSNGSTISLGVIPSSLYAVGNTFGTSSGTADERTYSISAGSGIQVAASNSGWVFGKVPASVSEPFPILTGTAYSSHAPASWWFNRVLLDAPLAISNINVAKSLPVAVPTDTLASSGKATISYSHGITVFSRQDYAANSSNLTTVTTASIGLTGSISYTSVSMSVAMSWVTNTTGGTTSFSTTSGAANWSNYFSGPFVFQIPCVTTLGQGEYFFAHAHSTTTSTSGNSNFTFLSFSNLHIAPQVAGPLQTLGQSITQASLNPWGMGGGIASAVTTNNTMPGSVISGQTQNNWYFAASNA